MPCENVFHEEIDCPTAGVRESEWCGPCREAHAHQAREIGTKHEDGSYCDRDTWYRLCNDKHVLMAAANKRAADLAAALRLAAMNHHLSALHHTDRPGFPSSSFDACRDGDCVAARDLLTQPLEVAAR